MRRWGRSIRRCARCARRSAARLGQGSAPPSEPKVYSLTARGQKLLIQWLSQPAVLPRMHHEFIHKLFQLGHVAPAGRVELVEGLHQALPRMAAFPSPRRGDAGAALKGPNAENAWFQLLSLRHLCRIVECEAEFRAADCGRDPCPFPHVRETSGKGRALPAKKARLSPAKRCRRRA